MEVSCGSESWGPLKAQKKVITATPVVEVNPCTGGSRAPAALPVVVSPPRSLAGFVAAHHALAALLPKPVQAMLPTVDPDRPVPPRLCDYGALLHWLKLPRFSVQDTAHNWIDHFAPSLPGVKRLVVDRPTDPLEFGAEP